MKQILVAALIALITSSAQALDPTRAISQYAHTAWRNRDGYFASAPSTVTQTKDGYIWIGTLAGLLRFDGVQFTRWIPPQDGSTLPSASIISLLASRDGSLWIGTFAGLARWSNGTLTLFPEVIGHINAILEDRGGRIWIARTRVSDGKGPVCEVVGSMARCFGKADGIEPAQGQALAIDSSGNLWLGSDGALTRWTPGSARTFFPLHARQTVRTSADAVAVSRDGGLWVGFYGTGEGAGLERLQGGIWKTVKIGSFNGTSVGIESLFVDSRNCLWVGTDSDGLYRIRGDTVDHFGTTDGLSGDHVTSVLEDEEHNIWVTTSTGVDCFRDLPVVSFTKREGLTADRAHSVYAAQDGTVWIGNLGALDTARNGSAKFFRHHGLPGTDAKALLVDHAGNLWVGVDNALYVYKDEHFSQIFDKKGNPSDLITQLTEDVDGSIWAVEQGAVRRLLHIRGQVIEEQIPEQIRRIASDPHGGIWWSSKTSISHMQNGVQKLLTVPPGIQIDYISDIVSDHYGAVWASIGQGVLRFDGDKAQLLGASNGLPCPSSGNLAFDRDGSLWLTESCGIVRIDHNSLQNWTEYPRSKVSTLLLDAFDGVQIGIADFRPWASLARDGRLWFVNGSIVQMLNPEDLHINPLPPPIHIERLIADHREAAIASAVHLPPLTRDIEIDYTALSFVTPQRVRFRYKLEGHDKEWQDGDARRSAFYMNLPPRHYRFLVTACNNSGIWNNQGASLDFTIPPAWYQTGWFRLLAFLSLAFLGYALYLLRMHQYEAAMRARFNERLDERTRIARELHDTLLQSFHGLMFQFQAARNLLPRRPQSAMQALDRAILATEEALAEGRDAIHDLRPESVAQHDLAELLRATGQELAKVHAANSHLPSFRVIVEGKSRKLSSRLQDEIYRIGGEVIRNAFRHAAASHIEVEIRYDEHDLRLRIRDDGKGIESRDLKANSRPGHWGLPGIRERAQRIGSRLEFWSERGAGTEVELRVPAAMAYEEERGGHRFRLFHRAESNGRLD